MDVCCSFKSFIFVRGSCSNDRRDRTKNTNIVPLLSCDKDISGHTSFLSITDVNSEVELLLARASIFSPPDDIQRLTICPFHRSSLGMGWNRGSQTCRVPQEISRHGEQGRKLPKADRGLSKAGSQMIMQLSQIFVPVGSGKYLTNGLGNEIDYWQLLAKRVIAGECRFILSFVESLLYKCLYILSSEILTYSY